MIIMVILTSVFCRVFFHPSPASFVNLVQVDGLEHGAKGRDPEAVERHTRRLEKRRERAALAAEEEIMTYG